MRKLQLARINKYIELFEKIHQGVLSELTSATPDLAKTSGYLQTAQSKAIELGTFIEEQEGLGHITVTHLEEYCELLFEVNTALSQIYGADNENVAPDTWPNQGVPYELIAKLDNILEIIRTSVEQDIKLKKLAVFLPYKASMWDSLESVWKKLDADDDWDAIVIPIPYFDKNADGSFKQEHYEGDLYPDYVPITRFDEFNLELEHPDVIYIHNPYDGLNFVTSVHPYFYSDKLKKHTDKLVYIPYFVLSEPDLTNSEEIDHLMMYACTAAAVNADEVIVQSENMRQGYIECLTKNFGEDTRQIWENKIKGTGSPKLEKAKNLKKEDMEIPEDWLRIIEKEDGTWKKIMFYNTGVSTLVNNEDTYLRKLKDVLRIFYENRDKVALLWRPHPLMEATLESMMPDKLEEYKTIKDEYIKAGWGIYDDTADMDRALAISDAYYGDGSSIVQLCQAREMPVMIQNMDVIESEE